MKHHELANLFPMLPDAELRSLADDIRENGLETPIVTLDGAILDGRNRHRACELAGVTPRFEEYTGNDPMQFVISHNLHRRHLTESQRGMVAARLATMKSSPGTNQYSSPPIDGDRPPSAKDREQAAKDLSVGISTLDRARKIQRLGSPELVAAVESGEVTVGAAYKVAELPQDEQREIVAGGADAVKDAAKKMRLATKPAITADPIQIHGKLPKYIPSDGVGIWIVAKNILERILPNDTEREEALKEAIQYCETRLKEKR